MTSLTSWPLHHERALPIAVTTRERLPKIV